MTGVQTCALPILAPIIAGEKIDDTFTTKITHFASKDLIRHHALTLVHMKTLTGVSGYGKFKQIGRASCRERV